jgi:hypothetical protein
MGLFDFFGFLKKNGNRRNGRSANSYASAYSHSRPKMSPLSFFNKIEERVNAFHPDQSFKAKTAITEINRFIGLNTEEEIIAALGTPVIKSGYEDQGNEFNSLKYNYSIFDYNVRLYFFLIKGNVCATLYEFKEVFPQKSQKLELIFRSLFNNYIAGVNEEEFMKRAMNESVFIADNKNNFVHISSHVLLNIYYVKNAAQLKMAFSSLKNTKEKNEREIEQLRLSQLKDNL